MKKILTGILVAVLLLNVAVAALGEETLYNVTSDFMGLLDETGISYEYTFGDDIDYVFVEDNGSYGAQVFFCMFNGSSISLYVYDVISFADEDRADVMEVCNNVNKTCKYMKFVVYDDNTVSMEFDMPLGDDGADYCLLMLSNAAYILAEAYPDFAGYAQ